MLTHKRTGRLESGRLPPEGGGMVVGRSVDKEEGMRQRTKTRWGRAPLAVLVVVGLLLAGTAVASAELPTIAETIYDSVPAVFPGSFPSLGYEATSTSEFGDHVAFAGVARQLTTVEVSLTSWTCENDFDALGAPLRDSDDACITAPGSSYVHPITLNLYEVDHSGADPALGTLIATKTIDADIPYRPSWDETMCTAQGETPETYQPFGGKWYDPVQAKCVTGYAFMLTFDFTADELILPGEVIYGIAYNTAHYGASPIGVIGDYDSLNVSVGAAGPTVGTTDTADTFLDSTWGGAYCDGGTGGTGTFRLDAGCWDGYVPVARFKTESPSCEGKPATLVGTTGDDVLKGTAGDDVIVGDEGNDTILGFAGDDLICGGPGNDRLFGGAGEDEMYGEAGNDYLRGGGTNDTMYGGEGDDSFRGLRGDDAIFGGDGFDTVSYLLSTQQVYVNLLAGTATGEGFDSLDSIERVQGSNFADSLRGSAGPDVLLGGFGDDHLFGGLGDDDLFAGPGNDFINGEEGWDLAKGGPGADVCLNSEEIFSC
jgi:hypothetical protein